MLQAKGIKAKAMIQTGDTLSGLHYQCFSPSQRPHSHLLFNFRNNHGTIYLRARYICGSVSQIDLLEGTSL
jgi:hypothetical protein